MYHRMKKKFELTQETIYVLYLLTGQCLYSNKTGSIQLYPCLNFTSGCPETHYSTEDLYKCKCFVKKNLTDFKTN